MILKHSKIIKNGFCIQFYNDMYRISYTLWTELVPGQSGSPVGCAGAPILIMERPNMQPLQNIEQRLAGAVTTCYCMGKGNMDVNAVFSSNMTSMDGQISLSTMADHTNFKTDVKNLMVCLHFSKAKYV